MTSCLRRTGYGRQPHYRPMWAELPKGDLIVNKRVLSAAAAVLAVVGLSACSASETDFQEAAETAITDAADTEGVEVTDVSCEEPGSTDVGTTFACSLTVEGTTYTAPAEITSDDEVVVDLAQMAPAGG